MSTTPEMPSSGLVVVDNSSGIIAEHGHVTLQQHQQLQQQQQHHTQQQPRSTTQQVQLVSSNNDAPNNTTQHTTLLTTAAGHYITSSGEIISNGQILKFVSEEEATTLLEQQHQLHQHHIHDDQPPITTQQQMHQQTQLIGPGAAAAQHQMSQQHSQQQHTITVNSVSPKVQLVNNVVHMTKQQQQQLQQQQQHHLLHPQQQAQQQTISFVQANSKSSGNSFTYITTSPNAAASGKPNVIVPIGANAPGAWQSGQQKQTTTVVNKLMNGSVVGTVTSTYKTLGASGGGAMLPPPTPANAVVVNHVLKTTTPPAIGPLTTTATIAATPANAVSAIGNSTASKPLTAHQRAMANRQASAAATTVTMQSGNTIHLNATTGQPGNRSGPVLLTTANNAVNQQHSQHIRSVAHQQQQQIVMQPPATPQQLKTSSQMQATGTKIVRGTAAATTGAISAPFKLSCGTAGTAATPSGRGKTVEIKIKKPNSLY